MRQKYTLQIIKVIHTIIWAFFALCITLVWILSFFGYYKQAILPIGVVLVEVVVLVINGWRCPLTAWAANYTNERSDNFDIYLPNWLAKHNMLIFGSLFFGAIVFTFLRWIGWFDL